MIKDNFAFGRIKNRKSIHIVGPAICPVRGVIRKYQLQCPKSGIGNTIIYVTCTMIVDKGLASAVHR